jgi:hypothetical protein
MPLRHFVAIRIKEVYLPQHPVVVKCPAGYTACLIPNCTLPQVIIGKDFFFFERSAPVPLSVPTVLDETPR